MAIISNVQLKIDTNVINKKRKVTVTYNIQFNAQEESAGFLFEEKVSLRGDDPLYDDDRGDLVTTFVKAAPGLIPRAFVRNVSQDRLDEDGDTIILGRRINAAKDELYAHVTLKPFAPKSTSANSNVVAGQFGPAG